MAKRLTVSASPHVRSKVTTTGVMLDVIIALMPALVMSVVYFGLRALVLTATCVVSCVGFEYISRKVMKRNNTIGDLSAVVTGLILAFNNSLDLVLTITGFTVCKGYMLIAVCTVIFVTGSGKSAAADCDICLIDCV